MAIARTGDCIPLVLLFVWSTRVVPLDSSQKTVSATAHTSHCSYTVVVNEFDVSKCPTLGERAQSDWAHAGGRHSSEARAGGRQRVAGSGSGGGEDAVSLSSLVKDMEAKLLDEMVRNRELNATLARHETLLGHAEKTLEAYRANFSSVFRTMMSMERKLQHQRKINRSLNKKLSNVILDVVEVNNVLTNKLPTGTPKSPSRSSRWRAART
ncbi:hypothetical protein Btru_016200 [Bulinus truncatus]|nr:hypothetical protein Btru_016200 [Bulinus truncatus]